MNDSAGGLPRMAARLSFPEEADMPVKHKICRALISVYDKTGIVEFARALHEEFGIEIISTGGTAKTLTDAGIPVTLVEDVTGFPELLDGRVKTLHPKIHAAILADRDNPEHMRQLAEQGIQPIDMVVVNLYPFEKTIAKPDCTFEEALEMIDIGGPCLLRAAAKNHKHVLVLCDGDDWPETIERLRKNDVDDATWRWIRLPNARRAFNVTREYDRKVGDYLARCGDMPVFDRTLELLSESRLRYGENPHQTGELLRVSGGRTGFAPVAHSNVEVSFNNYADASAALQLCAELTRASIGAPRGLKPAAPSRANGVAQQGGSPTEPEGREPFPKEEPRASACAAPEVPAGHPADQEPRASARAVHRPPAGIDAESLFQQPDPGSPTWLLTWTTYGSWLPGDERGFVSRRPGPEGEHVVHNIPGTPYDADQKGVEESARERQSGQTVALDQQHIETLLAAFDETASNHTINIIALSIMPDHVHLLCQGAQAGSDLMQLFKGISARRLSQTHKLTDAPRWWTKSGSKRHLRAGEGLQAATDYVRNQDGALWAGSVLDLLGDDACRRAGIARAAARGSLASGASRACCFIKHTNACGAAVAVPTDESPEARRAAALDAYRRAYLGDPNAAMGGILAVNFDVDADFAAAVMETYQRWGKPLTDAGAAYAPGAFFIEVWLAPSFDDGAVQIIRGEVEGKPHKPWGKRVRLLDVGDLGIEPDPDEMDLKRIAGGLLMQTRDLIGLNEEQWKVVTKRQPTESEISDLRLAWLICKHTKSNAITICKDGMLIGNGAGQMSRVMSGRIATWLAKENGHAEQLTGAVAASDAFFPFRDGPDALVDAGVTALIQPGGSKRDQDVIDACDERNVAMILTGTRHFRH
ncbi:MAG: transposase [Planctomycetes bacterium]|nr:transposase [Planctomycetota bacterium]